MENRILQAKNMATRNLPAYWGRNAFMIWCASLGVSLITTSVVSGFVDKNPSFVGSVVPKMTSTKIQSSKNAAPRASIHPLRQSLSSADVDADEDAEQRLGGEFDNDMANGIDDDEFLVGNGSDRWDGLLASTGLEGKLKHVPDLPDERKVSTFDIFCNRELKMENLAAIGFDMDYTLARYQQPAFDKLAFDGAKDKLVSKLG